MAHYIISFTVYTLAMSGLIALALFVYKKVTNISSLNKNSKILSIEETMMINPRKTLMIVKAGNERFLIASDIDKTSLIAKLNQNENITSVQEDKIISNNSIVDLNKIKNNIDKDNMDLLFPNKKENKNIKNESEKKFKKESSKKSEKKLHFEVISNKNPNLPITRKSHSNRKKNVTIEVGEVKNHGLSPIKEIVHKINEI